MNSKFFFISGVDKQRWFKLQNVLSLLKDSNPQDWERVEPLISDDYASLSSEFNLTLDPVSLPHKLFFSQYPDQIGKYLTHYSLYQRIIDEGLDGAFILEDNVCYSDFLSFLSINPNINEKSDIINLSTEPIGDLKCYCVTNSGAKRITKALSNTYWLQNYYRPIPSDYSSEESMDHYKAFLKSDSSIWNKEDCISAPLGTILEKALNLSKIKGESFSFVSSTNHPFSDFETNKSTYPDFWSMKEEELNEFIESPQFNYGRKKIIPKKQLLDFIFYINLDQDTQKAESTNLQLSTTQLPFERFPAVKPTSRSIQSGGEYHKFFKRNRFLESKAYFDEKLDVLNLEKYQLGTLGCYMSHYNLLKKIQRESQHLDHVAIIEDDVKLNDSNIPDIEKAIAEAPEDWDLIRSMWSSSNTLTLIDYCHPLSFYFQPEMIRKLIPAIVNIKYNCLACCPVIGAIFGGTHFQVVKVSSIPKILEYLDSEPLLPIDSLYTTNAINVYHKKMGIDFGNLDSGISVAR